MLNFDKRHYFLKSYVSILGCGWLGLDLAEHLIDQGFVVKGSTTTKGKIQNLSDRGIQPFLINILENTIEGDINAFLTQSDLLIITVPPGLRKNPHKNFLAEMALVKKNIVQSALKKVLYISSTSVFEDDYHMPVITSETRPNNPNKSAQQLIAVEQLFSDLPNKATTILRFAGLVGPDRHPGYYLQGKKEVANPLAPINLIHKTDCINSILRIIALELWGTTFNAAYPAHPIRKTYYTNFCKTHGLEPPTFKDFEKSKGKIIDSSALVKALNYEFKVKP